MKKIIINQAHNWGYWSEEYKQAVKNPQEGIGEKIVLETDSYRVWTIHLPAGKKLPFHKHHRPYFWIALSEGKSRSYYMDGSVVESEYTSSQVMNFPDLNDDNYFVHNLENIGGTTLVFTTVEFLK